MQDILKQLNDRNPCDLRTLDERGLRRFEVLCDAWAKIAEAELARRKSLPSQSLRRNRTNDELSHKPQS